MTDEELSDNLADIIWWIKGYNSALNEDITPDLGPDHIETLRQVRLSIQGKEKTNE